MKEFLKQIKKIMDEAPDLYEALRKDRW